MISAYRKIVVTTAPFLVLASGCQSVKNTLAPATQSPTAIPSPAIEQRIKVAKEKICALQVIDEATKSHLLEEEVPDLYALMGQAKSLQQHATILGLIMTAERKASKNQKAQQASINLYDKLTPQDKKIADDVCKKNSNPSSAFYQTPRPGVQ